MKSRFLQLLFAGAALAATTASVRPAAPDLTSAASQLTGQSSGETQLPADVVSGVKGLISSFDFTQINYASLAKDVLSSLKVGQDANALASLDKLGAAKLTPGQLTAFTTAKNVVAGFVLQRNFAEVPEVKTLVADATTMIKSGDYAGVVAKLQGMAAAVKPTAGQKAILDSLVASYKGWAEKK